MYNILAFFLFLAHQIFVVLALCKLYVLKAGEAASNQTVFLAFYRNSFLHSLLPLSDVTRYVRNAALILAFGITAAHVPFSQRRGRRGTQHVLAVVLTVFLFASKTASRGNDLFQTALAAALTASVLADVFKKEPDYEN